MLNTFLVCWEPGEAIITLSRLVYLAAIYSWFPGCFGASIIASILLTSFSTSGIVLVSFMGRWQLCWAFFS